MFSLLYKSNLIKSQNKTKTIYIIGSVVYILIHYILFNSVLDDIDYIQYPRYLIYIIFAFDIIYFNNQINKQQNSDTDNLSDLDNNFDMSDDKNIINYKLNDIIQKYQQPMIQSNIQDVSVQHKQDETRQKITEKPNIPVDSEIPQQEKKEIKTCNIQSGECKNNAESENFNIQNMKKQIEEEDKIKQEKLQQQQ